MKRVLIISSAYSQMQHIRQILLRNSDSFLICGTADNSVLGMSLIESTHPDLVVMPVHMNFWNAEDLINYLIPRGICPMFVLLMDENEPFIGETAQTKISAILPDALPTDSMLLHALNEGHDTQEPVTSQQAYRMKNSFVEHSMEVMELLMGLSPLKTREAQQKFGRLRVGNQNCWIILGAPWPEQAEEFLLLSRLELANSLFEKIPHLLAPLGNSEVCVYRESNLCILLAGGQPAEPEWDVWVVELNRLLAELDVPQMVFEISDMPMPMESWSSQCRDLLQQRQKRFFFSPSYLQPKTIHGYQKFVMQQQLNAQLSALTVAMQKLHRNQVLEELERLEELVCRSMSRNLFSYATTQMLIQYNNLCYSFNIQNYETLLSIQSSQMESAHNVFSIYRYALISLMAQLGQFTDSSNKIITEACNYISCNLSDLLSLDTVAAHVHVNPTYLSRLFKKETGISFNTYINQMRIAKAMQLLETGRKITDVSGMVGFDNSKYFSQVFKKQTGRTPREYLREKREENET